MLMYLWLFFNLPIVLIFIVVSFFTFKNEYGISVIEALKNNKINFYYNHISELFITRNLKHIFNIISLIIYFIIFKLYF